MPQRGCDEATLLLGVRRHGLPRGSASRSPSFCVSLFSLFSMLLSLPLSLISAYLLALSSVILSMQLSVSLLVSFSLCDLIFLYFSVSFYISHCISPSAFLSTSFYTSLFTFLFLAPLHLSLLHSLLPPPSVLVSPPRCLLQPGMSPLNKPSYFMASFAQLTEFSASCCSCHCRSYASWPPCSGSHVRGHKYLPSAG